MHHAHIDKFAYQDTVVHRLDSRVKFLTVVVFTVIVLSVPKTSVSILFCYAVWPFTILVLGRIPLKFVFKHILMIMPFVLILALSCPLYDKYRIDFVFGPYLWHITRGWLRGLVILGKFTVTMMALIALVSTTKFSDLLAALGKLGIPKILIVQLGFIYRYIFVLIDKAQHILTARSSRKLRYLGFNTELRVAASMAGSLFVRSIDSSEKIELAMRGRGFDGTWRSIRRLQTGFADVLFCLLSGLFFVFLYLFLTPLLR